MWALVQNNQVSKVIKSPEAITIGDVNYPSNIFSLWSVSELNAISIYEVTFDDTNYKNPEYWINGNQSFVYANGAVTASYGVATPRDLDDSGSGDTYVQGLKTTHKNTVDSQAYALLQPNDWLVVRNQEVGTAIPADWSTYRSDVRSTADDMKTKIDAVTTVDELAALYVYDPDTGTRPLGEFPTPPSN